MAPEPKPSIRPLVGRAAELASLDHLVARPEGGAAVAIAGEAGIGKTRLLRELRERASRAGAQVVYGQASEFEQDLPFQLVIDALDQIAGTLAPATGRRIGHDRLAELGSILPSVMGRPQTSTRQFDVERYRCHHAIRALLEELARAQPLLIAFDDLQWADPASIELVTFLLRRRIPRATLLLAFRPRPLPVRFASTLERAAQTGSLRLVELAPLTLEEAADFVGRPMAPNELRALHAESGGNPFFLEQLLRAGHHEDGTPRGSRVASPEVPALISMAIAQELDGVSDNARRLLEAGALAGEPFELDLAAEIAGLDGDDEVCAALDELVAADIVRETEAPRHLAFRHPIVRRAVYDATDFATRRIGHRRAADALDRRGAWIGARAHHVERFAVPGDDAAIRLLVDAGHAAAARAPAAAARWFAAALRLFPEDAPRDRLVAIQVALARALTSAGRLVQARDCLRNALSACPPGNPTVRNDIVTLLARTEQRLGPPARARVLLRDALQRTPPASHEATILQLELAENHLMSSEWSTAAAAAETARDLAAMIGDEWLSVAANACLARVANAIGDIPRTEACIEAALPGLQRAHGDASSPHVLEALVNLACAEIGTDRLEYAALHLERGLQLCRATGQEYLFARFLHAQAWTSLALGRLEAARHDAELGIEAAVLLDNDQSLAAIRAVRCWVATAQGDVSTALEQGAEAVEVAERAPSAMFAWHAHACYGEALIAAGDHERGRDELLKLGGNRLTAIRPGLRPYWYKVLGVSYAATGELAAAEDTAQRVEATAAALGLPSAAAAAAYTRAHIFMARDEPVPALERAVRSDALYTAAGMRVWSARAQLLAGQALALLGVPDAAERELQRSFDVFEACRAAASRDVARDALRRLGARASAPGELAGNAEAAVLPPLSQRERDVAHRIALGYTNRQIGEDLFLSERTIEKHVTRLLAKLRVTSRAAAAAVITRAARQH